MNSPIDSQQTQNDNDSITDISNNFFESCDYKLIKR